MPKQKPNHPWIKAFSAHKARKAHKAARLRIEDADDLDEDDRDHVAPCGMDPEPAAEADPDVAEAQDA